jgi:hypothetical protein
MSTFQKERKALFDLSRHREGLEARKRGQEQALRECKAKWYIPNAACDASYSLLEVVGEIKDYDGPIAAAARRERIAHESAVLAGENLEKSRRAFESTSVQAKAIVAAVTRTEHEIGAIKAALSDLRAEVQPHQILIDQFANALAEAKDVNLADARGARTERQLSVIAGDVDAAMVRSATAVRRADETLGTEWMKSCKVS